MTLVTGRGISGVVKCSQVCRGGEGLCELKCILKVWRLIRVKEFGGVECQDFASGLNSRQNSCHQHNQRIRNGVGDGAMRVSLVMKASNIKTSAGIPS